MKNQFNTNYGIGDVTKDTFDFLSNSSEFKLYVITVVFRASGTKPQEQKWISYYNKNVLNKIRRRLATGMAKRERAIPIDWLAQYELNERNYFGSDRSGRYPHHIHGLVPVYADRSNRISDELTGEIDQKLLRDLKTTREVSSVELEQYDRDKEYAWLNYMLKRKFPEQYSWNK